jgi:oligoribonuclease
MTEPILLWCDLETSGLDKRRDAIVEVALALTDDELNVVDTFTMPVRASRRSLRRIHANEVVQHMHASSGLLGQIGRTAAPLADVEHQAMRWLAGHYLAYHPRDAKLIGWKRKDVSLLIAGSTVHFDKAFIERDMPALAGLLNYRVFDVSTLTAEAKRRGIPFEYPADGGHRALPDILRSIELTRALREAHPFEVFA